MRKFKASTSEKKGRVILGRQFVVNRAQQSPHQRRATDRERKAEESRSTREARQERQHQFDRRDDLDECMHQSIATVCVFKIDAVIRNAFPVRVCGVTSPQSGRLLLRIESFFRLCIHVSFPKQYSFAYGSSGVCLGLPHSCL